MEWLANNESSLSAIAAIIAIIAGIAVTIRFTWSRMPGKGLGNLKRPAFLSDWRNRIGVRSCLLPWALVAFRNGQTTEN